MRRTFVTTALALLSAASCGDDGGGAGGGGATAGSAGNASGGAGATDASDDAPASGVVVHAIDTYVTESGSEQRPLDFSGYDIAALVRDPASNTFTSHPPTVRADGTLAFPSLPSGGEYYLRFAALGNPPAYIVTSASDLDLGRFQIGRPDVQPAHAGTTLIFNVGGLAPWQSSDSLELRSIGAGAALDEIQSAASSGAPAVGATALSGLTVDYASYADSPRLIDGKKGDRAWLMDLVSHSIGAGITYFSAAKAAQFPPFTQTDGQATTLVGSFTDVPQSSLGVDYKCSLFEQALLAANPDGTNVFSVLSLIAQPESSHGALVGAPRLLYTTTLSSTDLVATFDYGNPFPESYGLMLEGASLLRRSYVIGAASGSALNLIFSGIAPTGSSTLTPIVGPVQNPMVGSIDARQDQSGVGPNPELRWSPPALGEATLYVVSINRFIVGSSVLTSEYAGSISTTKNELVVPPGIMSAGNSYFFGIKAVSRPGIDGARQPFMSTLPEAEAGVLSGVITP